MKRGLGLAILSVLVISILLVSSVSAFSFNDFSNFFKNFWQRITGKATENLPPSATLSASPLSGEAPLTVRFTISCSDPDTDPGNYLAICSIEYGDNSVAPYVSEGGKPVSKTTQHIYSSAGIYTAVLKAVDYKMLETKKEVIITVSKSTAQPPVPTPSPSASPSPTPTASPIQGCVKQGTICTDRYGRHSDFCSSETEINRFVCQNNVCVRQGPAQCSAGMVCSKNENKCVKEAIVLNGYIQVATIKDTYNIGEKVELTDPPEEERIYAPNGEIEEIKKVNNDNYDNELGIHNPNLQLGLTILSNKNFEENKSLAFNGYIIQFEDKSIIEKKVELEKEAEKNKEYVEKAFVLNPIRMYKQFFSIMPEDVDKKVEKYSRDLEENNKKIKEKIKSKLSEKRAKITGEAISNSELEFRNEFTKVFNGISLDISTDEANALKEIPVVKAIYPNPLVNITLMDSVPLINADDVWQLDKNLNNCEETGEECLTGKGITIAIIDTGIDYTHPDLGGCLIPPETEYCFEEAEFFSAATKTENCTDSDGGINLCVKGRVRREKDYNFDGRISHDTIILYDICENPSVITERYCTESGEAITKEIPCPEGTACIKGFCVNDNKNYFESSCNKVVGGYDFVTCKSFNIFTGECLQEKTEDGDPIDDQGHGTHCAGIAAGDGILKGVAPEANLYAYKVLNSQGYGLFDWIIAGVERAVDPNQDNDTSDHVDIISMSLGTDALIAGDPLVQAVDNAVDAGVVVVVAAGNSYDYKTIKSPGISKKAITVGASNNEDVVADFSSKGPSPTEGFITKPDIIAPGVSICSAQLGSEWYDGQCVDDKHVALSGTSMATPHVAGAVALLLQKNPDLKPDEVKSILMGTSKKEGIKREIIEGHPNYPLDYSWVSNFCKEVKTNEVCTKVNIKKNIEKAYVTTTVRTSEEEVENSLFILRENSNNQPGEVIISKEISGIRKYLGSTKLDATIENINKGDYWLCIQSPTEFRVDYCNLFGNGIPDSYLHNDKDSFISGEIGSYARMSLQLKYYSDSVLDMGAGRLDILNALNPLIVTNHSINFGVVESSKQEELSIKNIENKEVELRVIIPKTRRVINISNYMSDWKERLESNLILDEEYRMLSTDTEYIRIPADGQAEIRITLNISKEAKPGYYAGIAELTDGIRNHTIPYSFVYPRITKMYAPPRQAPIIDGVLKLNEWTDAQKYKINNNFSIYLKTGDLNNKENLFIGLKSEDQDLSFINIYFDQGNSADGNKGSRNMALYALQEDTKKIFGGLYVSWSECKEIYSFTMGCVEPKCSPYKKDECWKCEMLDEFSGEECFYLPNTSWRKPALVGEITTFCDGTGDGVSSCSADAADFIGLWDGKEMEIAIPLVGNPVTDDLSDLNLVDNETVGFLLDTNGIIIPDYGYSSDAMTYAEIVLSNPPYRTEDCEIIGDEDGNGLADCEDPGCHEGSYCDISNTKTCQSGICTNILRCGNTIKEPKEDCDGTDDSACPKRCSQNCTCLPESKIVNNGSVDIRGNLTIKLEKKQENNWKSYKDVCSEQIVIPTNSLFKLDNLFNSLNITIPTAGTYRIYAALLDERGSIIETFNGRLESSYEFKVV